jgi:GNAT superfamily N-acetyltransferase
VNPSSFRAANECDAEAIAALIKDAVLPATLPGWTSNAMEGLFAKNSPEALRANIKEAAFTGVDIVDGAIVAFILSKKSRYLNLLVVTPQFQRRGIGSQLIMHLLKHVAEVAPEISVVEVNASEYSLPFYRRFGFCPLSEFIEYEGHRFVHLGYWRNNPMLSKREC